MITTAHIIHVAQCVFRQKIDLCIDVGFYSDIDRIGERNSGHYRYRYPFYGECREHGRDAMKESIWVSLYLTYGKRCEFGRDGGSRLSSFRDSLYQRLRECYEGRGRTFGI